MLLYSVYWYVFVCNGMYEPVSYVSVCIRVTLLCISAARWPMEARHPSFSREETEAFVSYARSRVGEVHGDRMLEWCSSPEYRSRNVSMKWTRTLSNSKPAWRWAHLILDNLGAKLVHFLVDYHHDWFSSLEPEKSDGKHKQLDGVEVQDVLDRLETIAEEHGEVQIFKNLQIAHTKFNGAQNV
jgi:hypothetical protein